MDDIENIYRDLLKKNIQKRKNGFSYQKIVGPGLIVCSILFFFVIPFADIFFGLNYLSAKNLPLLVFLYFGIMLVFVMVPQFISDDVRTTIWKTKRKYPKIYDSIFSYEYQLINEKMRNGMNAIIIDGETFFIGHYSRYDTQKSELKMIGYAVFNDKNEHIEDEEIFKKVFFTYNYGLIGSLSGQRTFFVEYGEFKEMTKVYVPRINRYLHRWKNQFSKYGISEAYERMLHQIHILSDAGNEILIFLINREKFKKSMGYSFAYNIFYEDAVLEYKVREAFYDFMMSKYFTSVDEIRVLSDSYLSDIKNRKGIIQHRLLRFRILRIHNYSVKIINFLNKMKYQGIPSDDDIRAFKIKNTYIKNYKSKNKNYLI